MLGNKRSHSVFQEENKEQSVASDQLNAITKQEDDSGETNLIPEMEQRMEELMTTHKNPKNTKELGTENRTHSLFFAPESEKRDFQTVLKEVQEYIASNYSVLITNQELDYAKEQMKRYIGKYVMDKRIAVLGMVGQELIDALYTEMAEYGFLTKYIFGKGIEEIDINSWQDIEVQYSDGRNVKLEEHFDSPEHAINVIRRMLHVSGMVLDNASPAVLGHLSKNIRIAVLKTPLVDEDVGIAASIRIVNPQSMKKEDFVRSGTATGEMLDFLSNLIRYGISVCVAGATSSGKTTVLGWLLTTIPNNKRIYTIENGSRELDLTRYEDGRVVNSVIHTITRDSENEKQRVDQITLLDMALRFNPDIAVVGEMRGAEANAAQEAARTGIAVLTTIHANSCEATYRRMVSLCKRAVDMSDETLMGYVTEAYPIIVFCKQLENKQRRMMEIMECEILADGTRNYRTLFQYVITENRMDEKGKFIIEGYHKQKGCISESLSKRLLENGITIEMINRMKRREESME
jgi:pilus assembly protein CpaF